MANLWTTVELARGRTARTAGRRPASGADDGIRTRDPHLGKKGVLFVHPCTLLYIVAGQRSDVAQAVDSERQRTEANASHWGQKWGQCSPTPQSNDRSPPDSEPSKALTACNNRCPPGQRPKDMRIRAVDHIVLGWEATECRGVCVEVRLRRLSALDQSRARMP
jgi:hypothetical protein